MEHCDRTRLRTTFASVAEEYDRVRPSYPAAVFDDLVELGGLSPGARVLEIGPGTGKATVELARRGLAVVGVELASELAEVACRNLATFPDASIVVADFENWEPEEPRFDAVVAFTAFHWIAPELRYAKPARLLREHGVLAAIATHHVSPADADPVWAEVQEVFATVVPESSGRPPGAPEEAPDLRVEMEASGLFSRVQVRRHGWAVTYTADDWIAVLGTYSPNIALAAETRNELFRRIRERIAARPGATATRHYLAVLTIGRLATAASHPRYGA